MKQNEVIGTAVVEVVDFAFDGKAEGEDGEFTYNVYNAKVKDCAFIGKGERLPFSTTKEHEVGDEVNILVGEVSGKLMCNEQILVSTVSLEDIKKNLKKRK